MIAEIAQNEIMQNLLSDTLVVNWSLFQLLVIWGSLSFIGLMFLLFAMITNREAWFWFWMRWSNNIAIAEFDDTGKVTFKKEKPIGQGVVKGNDDKFDYSITPRNIALDLAPAIRNETSLRFDAYMENILLQGLPEEEQKELEEEVKNYTDENRRIIYNTIFKTVSEEYVTVQEALNVATDLNRFRAFTAGTRSPFFVRYSGKAVVVNPLLAVVISGGKIARVQDLKTFIGKMITPSQIKYIASLSEMIGAKQLKRNTGIPSWIIIAGIFCLLLVIVFYGLPYLGIDIMGVGQPVG